MSKCNKFQPQVQISSGKWVNIGIPSPIFEEAESQKMDFPLGEKILAFRVIQLNCPQFKQKKCCGQ